MRIITSPQESVGWIQRREYHGLKVIEVFCDPDGNEFVRCMPAEVPDILVTFTQTLGLGELRLVEYSKSKFVRRANRKARRTQRELKRRGMVEV